MATIRGTIKELVKPAMTRGMFFLDFYIYPVLIIACLVLDYHGVRRGEIPRLLCLTFLGYLSWTFIEYVVHRFILHHVAAFRALHKAHHDASQELVGTPTIFSVSAFYFLGYLPIAEIFGMGTADAILTGLLVGYLSYVVVHYILHHIGSHGVRLLKLLKRRHAVHHQLPDTNFGVTTNIWDWVFGTLAK